MVSVLVVADDPDTIASLQATLEPTGHDVRTARDRRSVLGALEVERAAVILLDVDAQGLDGWALLQELKADTDDAVRTIPIVIVPAPRSDDARARGGIEGAVLQLDAPLSAAALQAALDQVLDGPPEHEQRRQAQHRGLALLATIERRAAGGEEPPGPRPRLSRLEHPPVPPRRTAVARTDPLVALDGELTAKQRALLDALVTTPSVSAAATSLGMSRSNVYASLRRIGRKVGVTDVAELLAMLRTGRLSSALDA